MEYVTLTSKATIKKYILKILAKEPGLVCKDIARKIRDVSGDRNIRKRDCNPILYRESNLFRYEGVAAAGKPPPRWYLRDDITPIATIGKIKKKKKR